MMYQKECDILKLIKIKNIFTIILIEHQSKIDYLMSYRILNYMSNIWNNYIKMVENDTPGLSKKKDFKLPPIVPIVFYTGTGTWTSVNNFMDKIGNKNLFQNYIPNFKYDIIGLDKISFEELKKMETIISFSMLMLKVRKKEDLNKLKNIIEDTKYIKKIDQKLNKSQKDFLKRILKIQLEVNKATDYQKKNIINNFEKGGINSMIQVWDMGATEQRGIEKGIEKGMEKGIEKTKQEIIIKMLNKKLPEKEICEITEVDIEKIQELKKIYMSK